MQETKGQLPFDSGLMHFVAVNHGGLNEFGDKGWIRPALSNRPAANLLLTTHSPSLLTHANQSGRVHSSDWQ